MGRKKAEGGFSAAIIAVVLLVALLLGFIGWLVMGTKALDKKTDNSQKNNSSQTDQTQKSSDPSEGGKYLVIKEWNVRFPLSQSTQSKVTYSLGEKQIDPEGVEIQAAKILIKNEDSGDNQCAYVPINQNSFIEAGAQILQTEKSKDINSQRYRWTFKENILTTTSSSYHLNYVTPDCAGQNTTNLIEELQNDMEKLEEVD